jgi:hypothetical protein
MAKKSSKLISELNSLSDSKFYLANDEPNFNLFYFNLLKSKTIPKGMYIEDNNDDKQINNLLENIINSKLMNIITDSINPRIIKSNLSKIDANKNKSDTEKYNEFKSYIKGILELLLRNAYIFLEQVKKENILINTQGITQNINIEEFSVLLENYLNIRYNKQLIVNLQSNNIPIKSDNRRLNANTNLNIVLKHLFYKLLSLLRLKNNGNINKKIKKYMMYMLIRIIIDKIKNPIEKLEIKTSNDKVLPELRSLNDSSDILEYKQDDPKFYNDYFNLLITKSNFPRNLDFILKYYIDPDDRNFILDTIFKNIFSSIVNNESIDKELIDKINEIRSRNLNNEDEELKNFKKSIKVFNDVLYRDALNFLLSNKTIQILVNEFNYNINKVINLEQLKIFLINFLNIRFNVNLRYKNKENREEQWYKDNKLSAKTSLSIVYKHFYYNNIQYIDETSLSENIQYYKMYILARILIDLINKKPQISERLSALPSRQKKLFKSTNKGSY